MMNKPPKAIWLQQEEDWRSEGFATGEEVTWCCTPQLDHDVKYIRADLVDNKDLEAQLAEALQDVKALNSLREEDIRVHQAQLAHKDKALADIEMYLVEDAVEPVTYEIVMDIITKAKGDLVMMRDEEMREEIKELNKKVTELEGQVQYLAEELAFYRHKVTGEVVSVLTGEVVSVPELKQLAYKIQVTFLCENCGKTGTKGFLTNENRIKNDEKGRAYFEVKCPKCGADHQVLTSLEQYKESQAADE
jgi:predicted RNA-binding Zn-ribbon protein involved in translation (DUF1610 family)